MSLTFDDGPHPVATRNVLDALDRAGVRATFFITGECAQANPDVVRDIAARGHEIGGHGFSHRYPWKTGPAATIRDLRKSARALAPFETGSRKLFRPPYGKLNLAGLLYLLWTGRELVFWTLDSEDYRAPDPREVVWAVEAGLKRGEVVLMHDNRRRSGSDPQVTVAALEAILAFIAEKRFRVVPVGELMAEARTGREKVRLNRIQVS